MIVKMKKDKCSKSLEKIDKKTERTEEEKKALTKRLNIIEGQVRGINQMIADDRYCNDILIQISSVCNSLKTLGHNILESHLKTCVVEDIKKGNLEIIDDIISLIKLQAD